MNCIYIGNTCDMYRIHNNIHINCQNVLMYILNVQKTALTGSGQCVERVRWGGGGGTLLVHNAHTMINNVINKTA